MDTLKENPAPKAWPEVELPKGWKKNPQAGRRLTWILLLTMLVCGAVTVISAGKSEILPVVCFLAIILLPIAGPAVSRIGCGADYPAARELHTVTGADVKTAQDGSACTLTAYRGPYQKLSFPDELDGLPIVGAADGLFRGNRIIAFVHLPQGLTAVSASMFERCDNLPAIVLPPAVRSIGARAFAGCTELRDVYITAATVEIAPDAFKGCQRLLFHVQEGSAAERFAREMDYLTTSR